MNEFLEKTMELASNYCPKWLIISLKKAVSEMEKGGEEQTDFTFLERMALLGVTQEDIDSSKDVDIFHLSRQVDLKNGFDDLKEKIDKAKSYLFEKAKWTTAYINTLSDSAFLHVEGGGKKDDEGKTVPRTLRHLPYKDSKGKIDLPHLRNALARLSQTKLSSETQGKIRSKAQRILEEQKEKTAKSLIFVQKELSRLEKIREKPLIGRCGEIFEEKYLNPLDLYREDVEFCVVKDFNPIEHPCSVIVALGRGAAAGLNGFEDITLPHPEAIRKYGDSGEVRRKLSRIKNLVDTRQNRLYDEINGLIHKSDHNDADLVGVKINKSIEEKRIVYGVVMDPYGKNGAQEDAHNDWTPPKEIEKTAHGYMKQSRVIKLQHQSDSDAKVVESWVEQYPSKNDYQKAMDGENHQVYRRPFGDDVIHSGSWLMGVELNKDDWASFKKGDFNAFSPGGTGFRQAMDKAEMPNVEFLDLK